LEQLKTSVFAVEHIKIYPNTLASKDFLLLIVLLLINRTEISLRTN